MEIHENATNSLTVYKYASGTFLLQILPFECWMYSFSIRRRYSHLATTTLFWKTLLSIYIRVSVEVELNLSQFMPRDFVVCYEIKL